MCYPQDSCFLPPSSDNATCGQGRIPPYAVHATTTDDVQKYVKFVNEHNLFSVIKNSEFHSNFPLPAFSATLTMKHPAPAAGHDYARRSSVKNAFTVWTHNMKGLTRNNHFIPARCDGDGEDAITAAAGETFGDFYKYCNDQNCTCVGGDTANVGAAGGWVQGAGHSVLSPKLGLGVDNVLQATIVLYNGIELTISR